MAFSLLGEESRRQAPRRGDYVEGGLESVVRVRPSCRASRSEGVVLVDGLNPLVPDQLTGAIEDAVEDCAAAALAE